MEYFSVKDRSEMPFQIYIGVRGCGKTYSALEYGLDSGKRFILIRRTEREVQNIMNEYGNPYKKIMANRGIAINANFSEKDGIGTFTDSENNIIGYAGAIATFSKLRGIDFSDVCTIVCDEAIPETHAHKIKAEGDAFLHMYETINRNRELDGENPVRCYILGNSISLNNPILLSLGMVSQIAKMKVHGSKRYTNRERGIYMELVEPTDFMQAKSQTALYRVSGGTDFSEQALNNNFTEDDFSHVKKVNLNEYRPFIVFDNYTIFSHKSEPIFYIAEKQTKTLKEMSFGYNDRKLLKLRYAPWYRLNKIDNAIAYDDYATELYFDTLFSRKSD